MILDAMSDGAGVAEGSSGGTGFRVMMRERPDPDLLSGCCVYMRWRNGVRGERGFGEVGE